MKLNKKTVLIIMGVLFLSGIIYFSCKEKTVINNNKIPSNKAQYNNTKAALQKESSLLSHNPERYKVPPPTEGWKNPPEKHYNEDVYIFNLRKKYLPRDVWDIQAGNWNLQKEEDAVKEAVSKHPDNVEVLYLLAYNQFDREKYDEAAQVFKRILEKSPNDELAHEGLVYTYYKKEKYETSKIMAEEALMSFPENPRLHHMLAGSYLFGERNPHKAVEIYKKALELDPNDERLWMGLGESWFEMKNEEGSIEGIKVLTQCIEKFPDYHIAYIVLAEEYQLQGDYPKAAALLEKSISLDPAYYRAYSIIGEMLEWLGRYREAERFYLRTLETNPRFEALIYVKMARFYREMEKKSLSKEYAEEALAIHENNPEVNLEKSMAYLELSRLAAEDKDFSRAEALIEKGVEAFPFCEYINYYRALLFMDQGKFDSARKEMNKYFSLEHTEESLEKWEIYYGLAQIEAAAGNNEEALQNLKKSVNQVKYYRKVKIPESAERDPYFARLRKTQEYQEFKQQWDSYKEKLPPLLINESLLL